VKFSPEVRERAVRLVFEQRGEHESQWAAVVSIAGKIGATPQTLLNFGIVTGHFGHRDRPSISAHRDRPFRRRGRPFRSS
jgi:transposase-like protein